MPRAGKNPDGTIIYVGNPGNQFSAGKRNRSKGARFMAELERECATRPAALTLIAAKLVQLAIDGEEWAIKEVANRFDGKPTEHREITGKDGESLFAGMETGEIRARLKALLSDPQTMNLLN